MLYTCTAFFICEIRFVDFLPLDVASDLERGLNASKNNAPPDLRDGDCDALLPLLTFGDSSSSDLRLSRDSVFDRIAFTSCGGMLCPWMVWPWVWLHVPAKQNKNRLQRPGTKRTLSNYIDREHRISKITKKTKLRTLQIIE